MRLRFLGEGELFLTRQYIAPTLPFSQETTIIVWDEEDFFPTDYDDFDEDDFSLSSTQCSGWRRGWLTLVLLCINICDLLQVCGFFPTNPFAQMGFRFVS